MTCEAVSQGEVKCGRGGEHPYFWFNDSEGVFDKKFEICQSDSQEVFGRLLRSEYIIKDRIDFLHKSVLNAQVHIRTSQSKLSNVVLYQERSKESEQQKRGYNKEINELQKKVKINSEKRQRLYKILNDLRNKTCRLCGDLLECDCNDCKVRQKSNRYSNVNLHSNRGFIREKILFHTLCGRIWVLQTMFVDQKIKQLLLPSKTGQFTIEESLFNTELKVN